MALVFRLLLRFLRLLLRFLLRDASAALATRVPAGVVPLLGRGGFVVPFFVGRDPPWRR